RVGCDHHQPARHRAGVDLVGTDGARSGCAGGLVPAVPGRPRAGVGAVGGIMNFSNNMMGVVAPIVTGFVVQGTHSFVDAFLIAGLVLLAGVAAFLFLLGPIEPLPEPLAPTSR